MRPMRPMGLMGLIGLMGPIGPISPIRPIGPTVLSGKASCQSITCAMSRLRPLHTGGNTPPLRSPGDWRAFLIESRLTPGPPKPFCSPVGRKRADRGESRSMIVTTNDLFRHTVWEVCRRSVQHQQPGTDRGPVPWQPGQVEVQRRGLQGGPRRPVHHPDFPRRPQLFRQAVPGSHDPYGGRGLPGSDLRRTPRPRHRRGLLRLHRQRLLQLGDDRRFARAATEEHRDYPPHRR